MLSWRSGAHELGHRLGNGTGLQFSIDAADSGADGVNADAKLVGYFFGALATGQEFQNLLFAFAEVLFRVWRNALSTEALYEQPRHMT